MTRKFSAAESFCGHALGFSRQHAVVFTDISFSLNPGDVLVVTGPNGSGKTSLLRILAGLLTPCSGTLNWREHRIIDEHSHRTNVSYMGHMNAIKSTLTVQKNIQLWAPPQADAMSYALRAMGLDSLKDQPARFLSAGQCKKVAIARCLFLNRPLWIMDEPTTTLDDEGVRQWKHCVDTHRQRGGMAVIATHAFLDLPRSMTLDLSPPAKSNAP